MKAQEPKKRADSFSTALQKQQQPSAYTLPGRDLLSHELSASQALFPGEEAEEEHSSSSTQIPFTVPTHQFSHISVHAPLRSHVPLLPKLAINQPGDPYEQEADAVAEEVMQAQGPGPRSFSEKPQIARKEGKSQPELTTPGLVAPPIVNDVLASSGQQLDSSTRAFMEPRFGHDFSQIRVHSDTRAAESARAINALAYTVGSNIVFGAGQYTPQTGEGRQLLAHELTHVVQQQSHETPGIQRQEAPPANTTSTQTPPTNAAPGTPGNVSMDEIPLNWVKEPDHNDILAVIANGQMLALPAQGSFVTVHIPPGATLPSQAPPAQAQPSQPVLAVPTVNKESMKVVNVGGRTGFMIDAGSESRVVFPAAMNAIRSALGVDTISGVLITHIHDDHVQSFLTLVRTQNIRPEGIHIPQAFTVNPAAPSSTLARAVAAMRTDPGLRSLGHGPDAHYNFYTPPAAGSVFQYAITQGDVTF
ncbi:MAG TPA: DUF4157 domain-containing protein, partial [Ktedonobacteraceae bacterium]|nr:DUF4157 domain-containing protein [Ktedonobacteraceae bacterium]